MLSAPLGLAPPRKAVRCSKCPAPMKVICGDAPLCLTCWSTCATCRAPISTGDPAFSCACGRREHVHCAKWSDGDTPALKGKCALCYKLARAKQPRDLPAGGPATLPPLGAAADPTAAAAPHTSASPASCGKRHCDASPPTAPVPRRRSSATDSATRASPVAATARGASSLAPGTARGASSLAPAPAASGTAAAADAPSSVTAASRSGSAPSLVASKAHLEGEAHARRAAYAADAAVGIAPLSRHNLVAKLTEMCELLQGVYGPIPDLPWRSTILGTLVALRSTHRTTNAWSGICDANLRVTGPPSHSSARAGPRAVPLSPHLHTSQMKFPGPNGEYDFKEMCKPERLADVEACLKHGPDWTKKARDIQSLINRTIEIFGVPSLEVLHTWSTWKVRQFVIAEFEGFSVKSVACLLLCAVSAAAAVATIAAPFTRPPPLCRSGTRWGGACSRLTPM